MAAADEALVVVAHLPCATRIYVAADAVVVVVVDDQQTHAIYYYCIYLPWHLLDCCWYSYYFLPLLWLLFVDAASSWE